MNTCHLQDQFAPDQEAWRTIPGLDGNYEVSNLGRVRSRDRYYWRAPSRRRPDPKGWYRLYPGKVLATPLGSHGYPVFTACGRPRLVHRAVLEAFVGPPPTPFHEALHRDDDKENPHLENLRWGTRSENVADAYRNGLQPSRRGKARRACLVDGVWQ